MASLPAFLKLPLKNSATASPKTKKALILLVRFSTIKFKEDKTQI